MVAGPDLPVSTSTHEDGEISDTQHSMETQTQSYKIYRPLSTLYHMVFKCSRMNTPIVSRSTHIYITQKLVTYYINIHEYHKP